MSSATYRAVRVAAVGAPSVMQVVSLPALVPGPKEVLVRVAAIGINPVEAYIRGGMHGRSPASLPYTPGHDAAGVIMACGDAVPPRLRVGDRVFTLSTRSGAYADTCVADEAAVHVIPAPLSFAQAACLGVPAYTAARALHQKLRVEPGKTVLVHGATGGVGVVAMQLARRAGLRVIGTAGTDDGVAAIAPYADVVLRHGTPALATEVRAATEGLGVHYILEMLANVNLATDFQCLRQGGGICIIGSRGEVTIAPRDIMRLEAHVTGVMLPAATPAEMSELHSIVEAAAEEGVLQPLIRRRFTSLADAPAAHEEVLSHSAGGAGKIIIELPME